MRAELRLHVEHVGRALVVPVPEAGVAWALQLQDILFPGGAERKGGGSRRKERWKGSREGGWKGGRQERRKENREPWLGTLRSRHRWWLEWVRQEVRKRGYCTSFYLDFFRCSSSGSCTERAEAGIDQEKIEGHPSPETQQKVTGHQSKLQRGRGPGWGPAGESALPWAATY